MFQPSAPKSLILSLSVYSLQTGSCPTEPRSNKPPGYQRPWDPCVFQPLQGKGLLNKALAARAALRWFRRIVIGRQNIKCTRKKFYEFFEVIIKVMWGLTQRRSIVAGEALMLKLHWFPQVSLSTGCHQSTDTQQHLLAMPLQVSHVSMQIKKH